MSKPIDEADTALLTEHFGYRPASLVDDIINSINTLAFKATDAIEQSLLSANPGQLGIKLPPRDTEDGEREAAAIEARLKVEIESGVHQLETLFSTRIDHNFDKMEIVMLRSYLNIPPEVRGWIRMNHYEGLNFTPNPDGPTTESITLQRLKLRETQKLHTLLLSESAQNAATIASLKALLFPPGGQKAPKTEPSDTQPELPSDHPTFAFLQNKGELTGDNTYPISTTTSFTMSQLPALKSLLENLGPRIKELKDGNGKDGYVGEAEKSWRRERLEFVETETKKHLEHSRGLELGEMGEVRDGEWQGEGRKLQKGEVEDLERVVGMVGGAEGVDAMDESA